MPTGNVDQSRGHIKRAHPTELKKKNTEGLVMSHEINVPEMLGDKNLPNFFKGWDWDDNPVSPVEINIFKGTHLAPWAVTLFGAYALWLREVRKKTVILNYGHL